MLKSALIWTTSNGRELLRLVEGGNEVTIIPLTFNESDLRELAKAAAEAADQLASYRSDGNGR
jgi:hypothetical protein